MTNTSIVKATLKSGYKQNICWTQVFKKEHFQNVLKVLYFHAQILYLTY